MTPKRHFRATSDNLRLNVGSQVVFHNFPRTTKQEEFQRFSGNHEADIGVHYNMADGPNVKNEGPEKNC